MSFSTFAGVAFGVVFLLWLILVLVFLVAAVKSIRNNSEHLISQGWTVESCHMFSGPVLRPPRVEESDER